MKITKQWLFENKACPPAIVAFEKEGLEGIELLDLLKEMAEDDNRQKVTEVYHDNTWSWTGWLIEHTFAYHHRTAIFNFREQYCDTTDNCNKCKMATLREAIRLLEEENSQAN